MVRVTGDKYCVLWSGPKHKKNGLGTRLREHHVIMHHSLVPPPFAFLYSKRAGGERLKCTNVCDSISDSMVTVKLHASKQSLFSQTIDSVSRIYAGTYLSFQKLQGNNIDSRHTHNMVLGLESMVIIIDVMAINATLVNANMSVHQSTKS